MQFSKELHFSPTEVSANQGVCASLMSRFCDAMIHYLSIGRLVPTATRRGILKRASSIVHSPVCAHHNLVSPSELNNKFSSCHPNASTS
ncbi:hypothetical protein CDAR_216961 [Caerostris darwini]|uniref:Uncharacterized protein n=1 Tax=Caerostris darwini TaxID=1538125 RepID=A0AAV4UU63_9ARAC|nr:hypothetical protein CDAR_216961 [Caerostris darwini]